VSVKIGIGCYPTSQLLQCGTRVAGSDASRYLPPLSAHRYSVVTHANAGRADEQPTTPFPETLPFRPPGHMSAAPSWSPWSRTVIPMHDGSGSFSFVCFFTHSVLLRPVKAARPSALLGEDDSTFNADRSGVLQEGVLKVHLCFGSRLLPPSKRSFRWKDGKSLGALVVLYPSLSFANSEFTFANNLRLNNTL
jgi:hypothetical protein